MTKMGEKCEFTKRDLDKNLAIDKIYIIFTRHKGLYIYNKKITMSEFNYKDYVANNPLLKEALEFMGTADEDTMKYLNSLGKDKLVALEKQFIDMFDTLRDIRYDGSEQLSKGASEISQRIHNFVTIIRQVLKGNPVIKEEKEEVKEVQDRTEALDKLRDILEDLKYMSKEANELLSSYFPSAHDRAEAYGALDFGTSSNRYDTTLESIIDGLERGIDVD